MAAITHGKAVLTSPPIVPMPFFKNGLNVLWAKTPSIPAYVSLFETLLSDDTLVSRLELGAKELSRHFDWNRIAIDHELVLQMRHR